MYLEIEDLAANALIEVLQNKGERFVSYKTLEEYGEAAANILRAKGKHVILLMSRDQTASMYDFYPKLFEEQTIDGVKGVSLREGQTADQLRRFRGYIPLDILLALVSPQAKKALDITPT